MNGFHVSQVLGQSALSSAGGPKAHRTYRGWLPGSCSFLHLLQCARYRLPFLFVPWYEKGWEELEAFQLFFFSHRDLPESEVCFIPVVKLSSQDFPSLPFPSSGLDLLFSWIPCFLLSGFTLTFSWSLKGVLRQFLMCACMERFPHHQQTVLWQQLGVL